MKFDPLYSPKIVKIETLSLRPIENYSRLNSRTVSRIQFTLDTWVDHQRDMTARSKGQRTRSRNVFN